MINKKSIVEFAPDSLIAKMCIRDRIIPDTAKERPQVAKVIAIGNIENPLISVGELVLYKKFSGTELEYEGRNPVSYTHLDVYKRQLNVLILIYQPEDKCTDSKKSVSYTHLDVYKRQP